MFGVSLTNAINSNTCGVCHSLITSFRDELSEREYQISGLCQLCQDKVFGEFEE